jgi:hypothetical protein
VGLGCCLDLRIAAYSGVRSGKTSLEVPELYKPSNCRVPRSSRFLQGAGVCTVTSFAGIRMTFPLFAHGIMRHFPR